MRITNAMMTQSVMWNISSNLNNMNTVYTQMASGEQYQSPSEDPVAAAKSLEYQAYLTELTQYESNIEDADSWLQMTESSIESMVDVVQRANELAIQAGNDTLTDDDRTKILAEIDELSNEIIQLGNTDYAGSYMFAGHDTDTAPFETLNKPEGETIAYKGDSLIPEGPFNMDASEADILSWYTLNSEGVFDEQAIEYPTSSLQTTQVNLDGFELLETGEGSLAETMELMQLYLSGERSYKQVDTSTTPVTVVTKELNIDEIIENMGASLDNLIEKQTEIGARMNSNQLKADRVSADIELFNNLLSESKDADIAQLSVEMAEAETVYEASLAASSKVIMPTLLNFI